LTLALTLVFFSLAAGAASSSAAGRTHHLDVVALLENVFEVDLFVKELLVGGEWRHLVANVGHAADVLVGFGVDNKHFKWNSLFEIGIEFLDLFIEKIHDGIALHRSLSAMACSVQIQPMSNTAEYLFIFEKKKKKKK
jgi:hypothetical protein